MWEGKIYNVNGQNWQCHVYDNTVLKQQTYRLDCSSTDLTCLIICTKCHKQLIGHSCKSLRYQIAYYIQSIEQAKTQKLSIPFYMITT